MNGTLLQSDNRHAALHGLIDLLPDPGSQWDRDRRDQFLRTFEAVLDFALSHYTLTMTSAMYTSPPEPCPGYDPRPLYGTPGPAPMSATERP